MHVGSSHRHAQGSARRVDQDCSACSQLGPGRWDCVQWRPPKRALPMEQSADCHSQSTPPSSSQPSTRTAQMPSSTPSSTQRWKVRWIVLSSPSSRGRRFHWQPLRIRKMMPSSTAVGRRVCAPYSGVGPYPGSPDPGSPDPGSPGESAPRDGPESPKSSPEFRPFPSSTPTLFPILTHAEFPVPAVHLPFEIVSYCLRPLHARLPSPITGPLLAPPPEIRLDDPVSIPAMSRSSAPTIRFGGFGFSASGATPAGRVNPSTAPRRPSLPVPG